MKSLGEMKAIARAIRTNRDNASRAIAPKGLREESEHIEVPSRCQCLDCRAERARWFHLDAYAARMRAKYLYQGKGCATRRKVVEQRLGSQAPGAQTPGGVNKRRGSGGNEEL